MIVFCLHYSLSVGTDAWPIGSYLKFLYGHQLGPSDRQQVRALPPGDISDISIQMHSPKECGLYQGQWRMCTGTGMYFGGKEYF